MDSNSEERPSHPLYSSWAIYLVDSTYRLLVRLSERNHHLEHLYSSIEWLISFFHSLSEYEYQDHSAAILISDIDTIAQCDLHAPARLSPIRKNHGFIPIPSCVTAMHAEKEEVLCLAQI